MLNKFSNENHNYINRLRVRSFRAHNDISFEPGNASVLILGSNGVGKTSVLEAISIFLERYIFSVSSTSGLPFALDAGSCRSFLRASLQNREDSLRKEVVLRLY